MVLPARTERQGKDPGAAQSGVRVACPLVPAYRCRFPVRELGAYSSPAGQRAAAAAGTA